MKLTKRHLRKLIEISLRAEPMIPGLDPTNPTNAEMIRKSSKLARGNLFSQGQASAVADALGYDPKDRPELEGENYSDQLGYYDRQLNRDTYFRSIGFTSPEDRMSEHDDYTEVLPLPEPYIDEDPETLLWEAVYELGYEGIEDLLFVDIESNMNAHHNAIALFEPTEKRRGSGYTTLTWVTLGTINGYKALKQSFASSGYEIIYV